MQRFRNFLGVLNRDLRPVIAIKNRSLSSQPNGYYPGMCATFDVSSVGVIITVNANGNGTEKTVSSSSEVGMSGMETTKKASSRSKKFISTECGSVLISGQWNVLSACLDVPVFVPTQFPTRFLIHSV